MRSDGMDSFIFRHNERGNDEPLSVPVVDDVELAFSKRVPQLDCPVPRSRNDLTVIRRKRNPGPISASRKLTPAFERVAFKAKQF